MYETRNVLEVLSMERRNVSSSNVRSVGYDQAAQILEIEFHSGGVYQYSNVPINVYTSLMNAPSKGGYFARIIKDSYLTKKLR